MEFTTIHKALNLSGFNTEADSKDQLTYSSTTLEKGHLAESFGYNHSMSNRVLGSEISKGLSKIITHLETKEKGLFKDMAKYLKESKAEPTSSVGSYITKGLDAFIDNLPKCFKYSEVDACVREMRAKDPSYNYDQCPMAKYNDASKDYVRCCVEKIYAKAMAKGIDSNRYYYLTVKQATQVGIGS